MSEEKKTVNITVTPDDIRLAVVFAEIAAERRRQTAKWGEQNHYAPTWALILGEEFGEVCQAALHDNFGGDHAGTLRTELVQVAAVAVQWLEYLNRIGYGNRTPIKHPGYDFDDKER